MNALKNLFEYRYGNGYSKSIFDNNISSSLSIILSDKQTSITIDEFNNAINKAINEKKTVVIENGNHTIEVDPNKGTIRLSGVNSKGGKFNIRFRLSPELLYIDNNCEVVTDDYTIKCSIPENFVKNATFKREVSNFVLNNPKESKVENIFSTSATSSIVRALGIESLDDDLLSDLLDHKKISTSQGYAYFDENDTLHIYSNINHVITKKTYECRGNVVVYKKNEMVRIVKEEIKYDEKNKDIVLPLLQKLETLEHEIILNEHRISNWEISLHECRHDDYDSSQYYQMINEARDQIRENQKLIKEITSQIHSLNNKR